MITGPVLINYNACINKQPYNIMKSQFLLSVKEHMLTRHYANKTIESYLFWIKRFIVFHQLAHPSKLSEDDVIRFLSHLAIDEKVAVKTQALALNAISFLYRDFF